MHEYGGVELNRFIDITKAIVSECKDLSDKHYPCLYGMVANDHFYLINSVAMMNAFTKASIGSLIKTNDFVFVKNLGEVSFSTTDCYVVDDFAKLKEVAERFKAHAGPIHPSPLFGAMTKDEALQLQLTHCAHHLSFLIPHSS